MAAALIAAKVKQVTEKFKLTPDEITPPQPWIRMDDEDPSAPVTPWTDKKGPDPMPFAGFMWRKLILKSLMIEKHVVTGAVIIHWENQHHRIIEEAKIKCEKLAGIDPAVKKSK